MLKKVYLTIISISVLSSINPLLSADSLPYGQQEHIDIPVLVINYFPTTDGINLDSSVTGWVSTLTNMRTRVTALTNETAAALSAGSKYHGYKVATASATLHYYIADTIEFLTVIPPGASAGGGVFFPDYMSILNSVNIKDYVNNRGIKQVWMWGYHHGNIAPVESNMSMGTVISQFWNGGTYGDWSNSYCTYDMPVCTNTYVLFNYNYTRGIDCAIEDHGHQFEAVFNRLDAFSGGMWGQFVNPHGYTDGRINHGGNCHCPPNTAVDYDWYNVTLTSSNAEDWHPDGSGQVKMVNKNTWINAWSDPDVSGGEGYKVWWMQNFPNKDYKFRFNEKQLRNCWDFVGDLDQALLSGGKCMYYDVSGDPANACVSTKTLSSMSLSWWGNNDARFRIDMSVDQVNWTTVKSWTDNISTSNVTISGLQPCTTYYFGVWGYHKDGYLTLSSATITSVTDSAPASSVSASTGVIVKINEDVHLEFLCGLGEITMDIPAGTFEDEVLMSLSETEAPCSDQPAIKPNAICLDIKNDKNLQPKKDIILTLVYGNPLVSVFNESKLSFARFDAEYHRWTVLPTVVYPDHNKLVAAIRHFSRFAVVQYAPADELTAVKAYPIPFSPGRDSNMIIDNLTTEAEIGIYNIAGERVRKIEYASADGRAFWDGKSDYGETIASGVYVMLVKNTAGKKVIKIAVEK
jgi:hypothetical protein